MDSRSTVLVAVALVIARVAVGGWFDGTPSESQAEAYWRSQFSNSNGMLRMTSFRKTDGKTVSTPGGSFYVIYYSLDFEVSEDCQYDANFHATKGIPQGLDSAFAFGAGRNIGNKGDQLVQTGEMWHEKRESGWQLIAVQNTRISLSPETQSRRRDAAEKQQQEIAKSKNETTEIASFSMSRDYDCPDGATITDASIKLHFHNGNYGRKEGSETISVASITAISDVYVSVSDEVSFTIGSPELTGPAENGSVRLAFADRNAGELLRNQLVQAYQAWRAKFPAAHK